MKIMLISMTCGEGHNQIANAIKNSLAGEGHETKVVQLFGYSESEIKKQNKIFLRACKYIPHLYAFVWHCERKRPTFYANTVIKQCKKYIKSQIDDYSPDVIICTHNNAGAVVGYLKNKGLLNGIKTYSVVFDYCLCPYWETNRGLDYIVYPHEFMENELLQKGFKKEQLLPFGLPVDKRFTINLDKKQTRKELGLDENKFTIAIYSGGNCISPADKLIKQLLKCKGEIQIIAICGKNQKQYDSIEKLIKKTGCDNILNLGFCTYLDKVYSAADVVFTRGGGMGMTEQLNKHIPMIIREKLIINENINKKYFAKNGMAIAMKKINDAPKIIDDLIQNPEKLHEMSKKEEEFCKPNSTEDFVKHIIK